MTPKKSILPERIGRYRIERVLGKGGEGVVLLALDSELERHVALKLLKPQAMGKEGELAGEARIVSRLQHPNIVTLHDVGNYHHLNYLVFEYIEGESLRARIDRTGAIPQAEAVVLMSQILAGVSYLHDNEIQHRDLSPSNILLGLDGTPKVTDFGLSLRKQVTSPTGEVAGTVRYMSPEPFSGLDWGLHSDVYTLGTIFLEMLTGRQRFGQSTPDEVIKAILEEPCIDVDALGLSLDEKLVNVLKGASALHPGARYPHARAMKTALDQYRLPRNGHQGETHAGHGTVDFLMRRMAVKKGFSALSQHINELLEITSDESQAPASRLVNIIAKDITLTQRLLTMANSAFYGKTEITGLARAVMMLGFEQVRMCITCALLENEFELGTLVLREGLLQSFHTAVLARALGAPCGVTNRADAFTCGLFSQLGRTLTIHYFPEEHGAIVHRAAKLGTDEDTESKAVLGVAYHELGEGIGMRWKFSDAIIAAMRPLPVGVVPTPTSPAEQLQGCSALAAAMSRTVFESVDAATRDDRLAALIERAASAVPLTLPRIHELLAEAAQFTQQYSKLLKIALEQSPGARRLVENPLPFDANAETANAA